MFTTVEKIIIFSSVAAVALGLFSEETDRTSGKRLEIGVNYFCEKFL